MTELSNQIKSTKLGFQPEEQDMGISIPETASVEKIRNPAY